MWMWRIDGDTPKRLQAATLPSEATLESYLDRDPSYSLTDSWSSAANCARTSRCGARHTAWAQDAWAGPREFETE